MVEKGTKKQENPKALINGRTVCQLLLVKNITKGKLCFWFWPWFWFGVGAFMCNDEEEDC